ncbi:hypothetical protein A7Q01_00325 [Eikenella sp. NML96-A-049]|uniref:DUF4189 domain-containing protein n=1 Tax=unclassified Eikenella TaxID=2639367 RepID=UPI0007E14E46|nr:MULTISPECIES: DUF4189 domain-containing protein [unclassified Eikenella]OAM33336.1 hypothetical protein A7P97_08680 [Eikenella sp. NML070372]OAM43167.1 hypothetical protein A7Q01_00325 [Eikenella sp. NML96-A-049]
MKQTMMNTAAGVLAAVLLGSAGLAYANPYPVGSQQWHNFNGIMQSEADRIQRERNAVRQQPINRGPTAAEIRAWEQREAEVQAEIVELRRTPFYMAIANDFGSNQMMWAGGFSTEQRAVEEALKQCRTSNCRVIKTLSNSCAVVVGATNHPRSDSDFFIGIHKDDRVAAHQAMQACETMHGKNHQDRCFYSTVRTKNGTAFCVGYDYSVYGQE